MLKTRLAAATAALLFSTTFGAGSAIAEVVTLDFTGVATTSNVVYVDGFYNGGTSSDGNTGTNYGVTFSPNALAINSYDGQNEPNPGLLYFLSGSNVFINREAGFTTGFSFKYVALSAATATVFDGLSGTGNILGTIALSGNYDPECGYCQWVNAGVNFAGTAKSIGFTGAAENVGFDQVTFGSAVAGAVPEPATWALMILGFGAVGGAMRRRQSVKANVRFA